MQLPRRLTNWLSGLGNLLRELSRHEEDDPFLTSWPSNDDLLDTHPLAWTKPAFAKWKFVHLWADQHQDDENPSWDNLYATATSYEIGPIRQVDDATLNALQARFLGKAGRVTVHLAGTNAVHNGLPEGHNVILLEGLQKVRPHIRIDGRPCALYRVGTPGRDGFVDFHEAAAKLRRRPA